MKNEIEFKFGDYAIIEQKRHGVPNEMFVHKVVGQLRSNTWVDVPVRVPATETLHGEMEDICLCICCGIDETEVRRYRVKDMRRHSPVSLVADEKRGSTITLQAVNELIQSLESAGELSIKETKVMALAKAYQQLAAENVALKNVFGPGDSVLNFLTIALRHTTYDQIDLDDVTLAFKMSLPETPATDRIVAGIKADGVEEFVSNTVHKIFDESEAVSALAYLSLANSHVKQLREGADK
ncbi:hypothetical protein N5C83_14590 [Klebsiella michiganensis]|nr:hypothetical protein [Klebsiella michiganensis]MDG9770909.1 hypothetical protein [Klebsiella michiganensis]MDH0949572.1 hypothetical protein [Klebsiella michiganensis]MDH1030732.1 hypothetical protein [Klebsiella michiganensis]MDH1829536.1 hypothetical protein [Klebsiella michiganensis]MDH1833542.1 hypothetical protein [Klebsiella michiganensis]